MALRELVQSFFASFFRKALRSIGTLFARTRTTAGTTYHPTADLRPTWAVLIWRRLIFTKSVRADVWQLQADILESGGDVSETFEAMAHAYRAQGKKDVAAILLELREAISRACFKDCVARYTGAGEQIIFQGYGKVGAAQVMQSAARLLRMEIALKSAILSAVAMPILLFAGLIGVVFLFGLQLYPALEQIADFDTLPGFQQWVIAIIIGFTARPWIPALVIGAFIAGIVWALPNWSGPGRTFADRLPPFSLVRLMTGAGFLFGVIEFGRSGGDVTRRLFVEMASGASPYAASRIMGIANAYQRAGNNLGAASLMAAQGFPAPELSAILQMLWNRRDGIEAAGKFTDRWLARVETTLKARMFVLNGALLCLIAAMLIVLMSIALPIVNQITGDLYS